MERTKILQLYKIPVFNLRYWLAAWSISFSHLYEEIKHMNNCLKQSSEHHW